MKSWKIWLKRRCMDFGRIWGKCNRLLFVFTARKLLADRMTSIHRDRLIGGYEIQESARLNIAKNLTKFGPILGLMGTLIPMGPALVGLSTGDVASMAYNMQVAFCNHCYRIIFGWDRLYFVTSETTVD